MAITIPIITEFADKGLKSAEAGFANFKSKVSEAEGGVNKMKAGFGAATDYMKANAATFAASAGAALVGFAIKGVGAFQDLALSASKFSDATGLGVEEASRWIEVAGDIGIEASTVQNSLNKLNRAVDTNRQAFKDLGIEIAYTKDGTTDVNQTFLNTIDRLKAIKDPAERARVATQLLGKGWTEMAELIQMGSGELQKSLDSVSEAKIIDEDEVRKAKEFRAAQDALNDAIQDLSITLGQELIPYLTDAANKLAGFSDKAWILGDVLDATISPGRYILGKGGDFFKWLTGGTDDADKAIVEFNEDLQTNRKVLNDVQYETMRLGRQVRNLDDDTNGLIDAWDTLLGKFGMTEAFDNVKDSLDNVYEAAGRALEEKTPAAAREAQQAVGDLYQEVADYIKLLGNVPAEKQTQILAALNRGDYDTVMRMLEELTRPRTVNIRTSMGQTVNPGDTPTESRGGAGVNVVGPDGRSYYIPPGLDFSGFGNSSNARSLSLASGPANNNPTVIVNVAGSVTTERDLVENIRRGLVNAQRNGAQLVYSNT